MIRIEISIDDGHPLDLKIFELLQKYQISHLATFYIPINNVEMPRMTDDHIRLISMHSEIGGHTVTHRVLTKLSMEEQIFEIKEGNRILSKIINKQVTRFAPPRGWTNTDVENIAKRCGVEYYRLMKQGCTYLPIIEPFAIVPITVHTHPYHIGEWKRLWKEANDKEDGYFHITMHGWEIDRFNYWGKIEEIFKVIHEKIYENSLSRY